jgi:hypothetical protein
MVAESVMRDSLKHSIADSPAQDSAFRYPKGSIILCNACAAPVAVLEQGIALGDKGGRMAQAFKPLRSTDLDTLARRDDIDAGVRAWAMHLTPDARQTYLRGLKEFRTGDPMVCPTCHECFVQVLAVDRHEVLDKAYVIELVSIPPEGQRGVPVRGKPIGVGKGWIHQAAKAVH